MKKTSKTPKKGGLIRRFLIAIGLAPSHRDQQLSELVNSSYKSLRVVGRGTIKIDTQEVSQTPEFKAAREKARKIVVVSQASMSKK